MTKKINTVGCDNLVESAFVPETTQAHDYRPTREIKDAARNDIGAAPVLSWDDLFDGEFNVSNTYRGVPEEGIHKVRLDGEPVVRKGKEGTYATFELVDISTGCCWSHYVSADSIKEVLNNINFYNNGFLRGLNQAQILHKLTTKEFDCWTLQTEKGNTATYFNGEKYSKRLYVMELNHEREMQRKQREKEKLDNDARMAEEAAMGNDKAPWEEK